MLENNIKFASFADIFARSSMVLLMFLFLVVAVFYAICSSPHVSQQPLLKGKAHRNCSRFVARCSSCCSLLLLTVLRLHSLCDDPCCSSGVCWQNLWLVIGYRSELSKHNHTFIRFCIRRTGAFRFSDVLYGFSKMRPTRFICLLSEH